MKDRLSGILPVVQTALTDDGDFDLAGMERQIEFCIRAGADGLVFPVLGSEFMFLSDNERRDLVAFIVNHAAGRIPFIAGVAGASTAIAVEQAAHAAQVGADAVIAMPPYVAVASPDQIFDYFKCIAGAAQIPVVIQHAPLGPGMNIAFLKRLLAEVENINYIKEEMDPQRPPHQRTCRSADSRLLGHIRWRILPLDDVGARPWRDGLHAGGGNRRYPCPDLARLSSR